MHNSHAFPVDTLIPQDTLPVADEEVDIKVRLRRTVAPIGDRATEEEGYRPEVTETRICIARWQKISVGKGGREEGIYEWVCRGLEAGMEISLETEWVCLMFVTLS